MLGLHIAGKELPLKLDKLMEPGESIKFYRKARPSFLFYTARTGKMLKNPQELSDYMKSGKKVYCVMKNDDWEDVEYLQDAMQIVEKFGDMLIVSN